MMPLRTGPTIFFAFSPIWWQALHTTKTFSPAAASCARASPTPTIARTAAKVTARILFSYRGCALMTELCGIVCIVAGSIDDAPPASKHVVESSQTAVYSVSLLAKLPHSNPAPAIRPLSTIRTLVSGERREYLREFFGQHVNWLQP